MYLKNEWGWVKIPWTMDCGGSLGGGEWGWKWQVWVVSVSCKLNFSRVRVTPAVLISFRAMIRFSSDVDKKLAYIIAFTLLHSLFYSSNLSTFVFLIYCQPRRARPQGHIVWARKTRNGRGGGGEGMPEKSRLFFADFSLTPREPTGNGLAQHKQWQHVSTWITRNSGRLSRVFLGLVLTKLTSWAARWPGLFSYTTNKHSAN